MYIILDSAPACAVRIVRRLTSGPHLRLLGVVLLTLLALAWNGAVAAALDREAAWIRVEMVENTLEGPAFDRCEVEGAVQVGTARRWRFFYGEAKTGEATGWEAMQPRSGCAAVASQQVPDPWTLSGSPYLIIDAELRPMTAPDRDVHLQAQLAFQRLTGFEKVDKPTYERRAETRTLHIPQDGSVVIPLLLANPAETDAFGVHEVLMRVYAAGSVPPVEYGEIAVTADVPRAQILLDGGFIGYTSSTKPTVLRTVRTGERTVTVRDASGREVRAVAHVEKDLRAEVSLTLLPSVTGAVPGGLRRLGRNRQGGEEFWREKDGAILVRIPGGDFQMGSTEGAGEAAERPQHLVRVGGFLMDKTEVTWGQYLQFVAQTGRRLPKLPVWGAPEAFPASFLTWEQARAFCEWAGGRLPTEAEWEWAARGADGRTYPWGDEWDPSRCSTRDGGPHRPTPVASYPGCASPQGVLDLAGSVWEWCQDGYDAAYYAKSPADDPPGPETGRTRVSRGGGWMTHQFGVRGAQRQGIDPTWPDPMRGFRCVQPDPKGAGE